jgi:hypothetical protein
MGESNWNWKQILGKQIIEGARACNSPFYGPVLSAFDAARLFASGFSNHFNSTASFE